MASSSPLLNIDELTAVASDGGYTRNPRLSELTSVICLSALLAIRQKWMWQLAINPIDEDTWQDINEQLDNATWELMRNSIGEIVSFITDISDDSLIRLDGTSVLIADYPILANVVPAFWLSGLEILLPDLRTVGEFGAVDGTDVGTYFGSNTETLSTAQIPSHNHTQLPHTHTTVVPLITPVGAVPVPPTPNVVIGTPAITAPTTATNLVTGGGGSHNNIQESLLVFYFIVGK